MATTAVPPRDRISGHGWAALILVSLTLAISMIDRQILSILLPRVKADLGVGDAEMGLLYGTVFAVFYALFSLPLGRLADGWKRTRILAISIVGWSLMTGLGGFASTFAMLAVTRLGVGIGEASVYPAGMSLLSDLLPRNRRGLIGASFGIAIAIGLGGALWYGGAVADGWDAAYPNGGPLGLNGWHAAFAIAAIPGILLGIALLFLPEPVRGAMDGIETPPDPAPFRAAGSVFMQMLPGLVWIYFARVKAPARAWLLNIAALVVVVFAAITLTHFTDGLRATNPVALKVGTLEMDGNALQWSIVGFGLYILICWSQSLKLRDAPTHAVIFGTPTLNALVAMAVLQIVINYGVMGFSSPYIIRHFHQSAGDVGFTFGLLSMVIGIMGPVIAGPLSDFFRVRHPRGRLLLLLGSMVGTPIAAYFVYTAETLTGFYMMFVVLSIILTMWLPPLYATILDLVLPRMRGTMMAYYTLITTMLGLGTGPYMVGLISDMSGGDLGHAILSLFWLSPLIVLATLFAVIRLPSDEASLLDRARAAGEPV
jgi:MFS family permease